MTLIDTHIHLYAEEYNNDRESLINAALDAGIEQFLMPNIDCESLEGMLQLWEMRKDRCRPMLGLHPCSVKDDYKSQLKIIRNSLELNRQNAVAIGETGLDFYWDLTFKKQQEMALREQAAWAIEFDLPLVIHSRNSTDAIIEILKEINNPHLRGVFHCFSGNAEQAAQIVELGFYLGIGGVVTFKNSGLDKVLVDLPSSRIILETDGPYLAPAPFRGKRNEPAYLKLIAEKAASVKGISFEELAGITTTNAKQLFRIS